MKKIVIASSICLLVACQSSGPSSSPTTSSTSSTSSASPVTGSNDDCGAQSRQRLVGTAVDNLNSSSLPPGTRILRPTSLATTDYRPDRLNILVDEDGKIERVRCG